MGKYSKVLEVRDCTFYFIIQFDMTDHQEVHRRERAEQRARNSNLQYEGLDFDGGKYIRVCVCERERADQRARNSNLQYEGIDFDGGKYIRVCVCV